MKTSFNNQIDMYYIANHKELWACDIRVFELNNCPILSAFLLVDRASSASLQETTNQHVHHKSAWH